MRILAALRHPGKTCYAKAPETKKEKDGRMMPKQLSGSLRNGRLDVHAEIRNPN
jgi:hypothetical protein